MAERVGLKNVPKTGPLIVVANHQNQFVDAMMLVTQVPRLVSFIIAEKSMHKPIIGARAHALPALAPPSLPPASARDSHAWLAGGLHRWVRCAAAPTAAGPVARALKSVPVIRPQDRKKPGTGTIREIVAQPDAAGPSLQDRCAWFCNAAAWTPKRC